MSDHRKGPYSEDELAYLEENYLSKTDKELSKEMNRHSHGIYMVRKSRGWTKAKGGKRLSKSMLKDEEFTKKNNPDYVSPTESLTVEQKKRLFLNKFNASSRGDIVKKICMKDEIKYYKERWCSYLDSVDNITSAEEETLHQIIMDEVFIIRYEEEIKGRIEHANRLRDEARAKGDNIDISSIDINVSNELKNTKEHHIKLVKMLDVSREQRLKRKGDNTMNFVNVCQLLAKREERNKLGKEAAIIEYMKDKEVERLRKGNYLIGGQE